MKSSALLTRFGAGSMAAAIMAGNIIRARTHDNFMTFDATQLGMAPIDGLGNMRGKTFDHAIKVPTVDAAGKQVVRTYDSTGAFMVGELERLDQTMHMPLAAVTWSRDINLREDVSLADEVTSFTLTTFGSAGGLQAGNGGAAGASRNGKAWIGKNTNQIGGVAVDIGKLTFPLTPWALELKYTVLELESAAKLGRPIDAQKFEALSLKHNMDVDEQVYVGDAQLSHTGLVNNSLVTNVSNVAADGTGSSTLWTTKTPAQILRDVNEVLQSVWAASGYAVMPKKLLLPPAQFGYISTQLVGTAGSVSILTYIMTNNIVTASMGMKLDIQPAKWLVGSGAGGTIGTADGHDRMVAYTQEKQFVRFPLVPLSRTPIQYDSIFHKCSYYGRIGVVEVVYPETFGYRDGL